MVTIGISGHRHLAELEKVINGVDQALARIVSVYGESDFTLMSCLAEGVEQLVLGRALTRYPARLIAILPLNAQDYLADFESAEARGEFHSLLAQASEVIELPHVGTREQAYLAAGLYLLEKCDVLLAVWDGLPAQGQGGTGEIVAQARRRGLPLAWVHAGNRKPGTNQATSLGEEQGKVSFERMPGA
jgi:hypothetical protein